MVQTNQNSCCTPDAPCINHRPSANKFENSNPTAGQRVVLMDPSRMPAENPLYRQGGVVVLMVGGQRGQVFLCKRALW